LAPAALAVLGRALLVPVGLLLPLPAWLCRKTLQRQAGRIAAGVVGLAVVLLAFLGLKSITASLRGEVDQFAAAALTGCAFVQVPARSAAVAAAFAKVPGGAAVEAVEG